MLINNGLTLTVHKILAQDRFAASIAAFLGPYSHVEDLTYSEYATTFKMPRTQYASRGRLCGPIIHHDLRISGNFYLKAIKNNKIIHIHSSEFKPHNKLVHSST